MARGVSGTALALVGPLLALAPALDMTAAAILAAAAQLSLGKAA